MKKLIITILFSLFVVQFSYSQDPIWTISAPTSNWFGTGNTERGLGFNPATGNLIVASRQGGVTPVLVDAATGDSVGILKNKEVTFSENFEGISASGDAVTGWVFTNAQTWVLGGLGNNSDKYAGWGESSNTDHSIQSPLITDPGVLSFYIAGYGDATNTKVVVETSPDGTTWTSVDTLVSKGAGGDFGISYIKKSYNLNKTGDYYIRWSTTEHVDGGFYLDDIEFHNPISGGTFAFNQIKASADGQIFTANLAINGESRIYRWADEMAEPELVYAGNLGGRLGDSFGVVGEGDGVRVLLSGTGADKVEAFDWDGTELTHAATFPIAIGEARGGFSSHVYEDSVLISGTNTVPRLMNINDGGLGRSLSAMGDRNMTNDILKRGDKSFAVLGPNFGSNYEFRLFDFSDKNNIESINTFNLGQNQNLNNTGGVIFDDINDRLYLMNTNNSIKAFNISDFINNDPAQGTNDQNIVLNGDFSLGDSNWVLDYYNGADERGSSIQVVDGELVFSGLTGYYAPFDVQAHQVLDTDKLQQDAKYRLTFDARTSEGTHELFVFLGEIGGAWNRYWSSAHPAYGDNPASNGSGDIVVDTSMRTYTLDAIADTVYSDMYLSFEVDFEPGDVTIDNVKLERIYDDPITNNPYWTHDPGFQATQDSIPSVHGVAVDGEGKVWVQPYYATETIIMNRDVEADGIPDTLSTRAIYIYHPDGTQASFSPLKVINYPNGSADTLGHVWYPDDSDAVDGGSYQGYSGRGITADAEGNIIISAYNRLYKVDYTDGSGIAMVDPSAGCSLTEATTDDANNVYVGCVVGSAGPLMKFAPDLTGEEALVTIPGSFSRDLQVSGDGNTIWWAGYTNGAVHRFSRDDEFSSFGDADTVLRGIKAEVFDIHPITGHLWVGSGSLNDVPADPYEPQRWYAFDVDNLEGSPTPLDTIAWVADPNSSFFGGPGSFDGTYDQARPRALDFSPDGKTAYVGTFAIDNAFQRFTKGEVTVPPPPTDTRKRIDMIVNMKYQELLGNFTNSPEDSVETYVGVYGNFNNWDPTNYAGLAAINDSIYTGEILLDTTMHSELQYRFVIASSTNGIIDIEDNDPVVSSDGQELVNYRWLEVDSSPGLQYSPRVYFSDIGPKEYLLESLPLLSIEQARAQERGSKVMIEGVVTRVTYNFVYLQDGTAGMLLFSRPWHSDLNSLGFWEAASNGEIQVGDRLKVAGVLDEYQGSQEVVSLAGWKVISKGNELLYTTLDSFDELATNGEAYESQLIRMNNLRFMSTDSTYSYVAYPVMSSNDGSVGYLFMFGANNNPWFGEQFSSKPFSFEGVVRQVLHQGELVYALAPHYREDLKFAGLDNKNMYLGTSYTKEGFKFSNSLSLDNLNTVDSLMSYQFNLKVPKGIRYDSLKLYHSESSPMLVSNFRDSVLSVAVTGSGFITNHHPLIELFFHAEEVGSYTLNLSAVKLNEVQLDEYYPGLVRIDPFMLGDVDDNGEIDAYDAGIVLHQTVGSQILKADPIPSWDQGPWFNWRDGAADVDGDGELLAIDAAQILKYVVGLIDDFTETQPSVESVHIEVTSEGLIISAPEGIEGLNINLPELEGITFSDPDITWENASSVVSKEEGLRIAIASTDVKTGQVLKIPYNMGVDDRQTVQVISYTNGKKMVHEVQLKGINVSNEDDSGLPQEYALSQNYPNPFNPSTKIQYALPKAGDVRIDIYSMLGQKVATLVDTHQPAGYHTATFDASQLSSGVYLYKLTTPGFSQTKKMLLIK